MNSEEAPLVPPFPPTRDDAEWIRALHSVGRRSVRLAARKYADPEIGEIHISQHNYCGTLRTSCTCISVDRRAAVATFSHNPDFGWIEVFK
jgi:hypothetical protein